MINEWKDKQIELENRIINFENDMRLAGLDI